MRSMISPARSASATIHSSASRTSPRSGGFLSKKRTAARAQSRNPLANNTLKPLCSCGEIISGRHSRAALRQIGLTESHTQDRRALRWIQINRKPEVSLLDIRREALGRRLHAEQTRRLLDVLVRAGWLKLVTTKTDGRAIHRWQVNQLLFSSAPPPERSERSERGSLS
jgi:hypothetical protein